MKVIDAVWEQRNLGIHAYEIEMEMGDIQEEFENQIRNMSADYISVKLPTGMTEFLNIIQANGFTYCEDLIHVRHDLHSTQRNSIQQRMYDLISYHMMDESEILELKQEIKDGMFSTDRFSTSGRFSKEQCANRFSNWVDDLLSNGAIPYVMEYKGQHSGFIILTTKDDKVYQSVLGGAYAKFRKSGLGIVQKEQEIVKNLGGKYVETTVSSNNIGQLKALIANGYMPVLIEHVFIKEVKNGGKFDE